ncbi:MAG: YeeE/YedE thiosulfate transporter family protein [Paracoccaceae bacterium]
MNRRHAWLFSAAPALAAISAQAASALEPALDARTYPGAAWSPYLVGAGIGVLSWLTFYFADKPIGASSFYATVSGMIGKAIAPRHTESLEYFKTKPPKLNYGFVFVIAAIGGAAFAALTGGNVVNAWVPDMWSARFGDGIALRGAAAFSGGMLMAFGARLAGGCTSGHGISGTLQLSVASWIALICFFIGGAAIANLMFRI